MLKLGDDYCVYKHILKSVFSKTNSSVVKSTLHISCKNVYEEKLLSCSRCMCIKHEDHENVAVFTKSWGTAQTLPFPYEYNEPYRPKEVAQGHSPTLATTEWPNLRKCI